MKTTARFVAFGAALFGVVGVTAFQARGLGSGNDVAAGPGSVPGRTMRPATAEPLAGVAAEGRVVTYPGAEVQVGAERAGRLLSVRVEEGDHVRRGQLLAEIESDELRAALAEARSRVEESEAEARLAEANLIRRQKLHEEKIVAVDALDQAVRDLETARARVETAKASVTRYEAQVRKSRIEAPIEGTVTARRVDAGQMVETGNHAFTVADLGRLRIEGETHEADAPVVALGAAVTISADGYPDRTWRGRVEEVPDSLTLRRIKPQDPSRPTDVRVLAVKVAFTEPTPLKLGTTVDLRIAPAER